MKAGKANLQSWGSLHMYLVRCFYFLHQRVLKSESFNWFYICSGSPLIISIMFVMCFRLNVQFLKEYLRYIANLVLYMYISAVIALEMLAFCR